MSNTIKSNSLCVMIPVHKPNLHADDIISLNACKQHLGHYDCFLVYPLGMNVDAYVEKFDSLKLKPVNPSWLSSVENYNRMKIDINFYQLFNEYKFMMTYELDAYIFNSNIEDYKIYEYDYIGAPFFEWYLHALPDAPFIKGGNSGFSVRNIQSCISVLKDFKNYRTPWIIYNRFLSKIPHKIYNAFLYRFNKYTKDSKYKPIVNGELAFYFEHKHINEDIVWSQIVPLLFPWFKIADPIDAWKFSFEALPNRLLLLNSGQLPLGCHGWPKQKQFWKNYIKTI